MSKQKVKPTLGDVARGMWNPFSWLLQLPMRTKGDLEHRIDRLEAELEVRDLLNRYACLYDGNNLEAFLEVFHEDALLVASRGTYVGADAIRRNYGWLISLRQFSFHYINNVSVRFTDDSNSWVSCYYQAVQLHPSNVLDSTGGTYIHHLTKRGGNWRIAETRITANFRQVLNAEPGPPRPGSPEPTNPETSKDWVKSEASSNG
jgi:3-phenylpropionate/cinnamic acid dioxygenase small subunit